MTDQKRKRAVDLDKCTEIDRWLAVILCSANSLSCGIHLYFALLLLLPTIYILDLVVSRESLIETNIISLSITAALGGGGGGGGGGGRESLVSVACACAQLM